MSGFPLFMQPLGVSWCTECHGTGRTKMMSEQEIIDALEMLREEQEENGDRDDTDA